MNELTQIEVNGNPNAPVSRGEFAEAMGYVGNAFGRIQQTLHEHGERLSQLEDRLDRVEQRLDGVERAVGELKQSVEELGERILSHIDAAVENRQVDLGAAKSEHVTLLGEKVDDHEQRIGTLEAQRP